VNDLSHGALLGFRYLTGPYRAGDGVLYRAASIQPMIYEKFRRGPANGRGNVCEIDGGRFERIFKEHGRTSIC
jgi:hypothetical protein